MDEKTFSEHDIDVLLAALHNHALKRRVEPREAYDLQVKLLALIGKNMPVTFEEVQAMAKEVQRG